MIENELRDVRQEDERLASGRARGIAEHHAQQRGVHGRGAWHEDARATVQIRVLRRLLRNFTWAKCGKRERIDDEVVFEGRVRGLLYAIMATLGSHVALRCQGDL